MATEQDTQPLIWQQLLQQQLQQAPQAEPADLVTYHESDPRPGEFGSEEEEDAPNIRSEPEPRSNAVVEGDDPEDPQEYLRLSARGQQLRSHVEQIEQQQRQAAELQAREDHSRLQQRIGTPNRLSRANRIGPKVNRFGQGHVKLCCSSSRL
jgi:hypothetical protein